MKGRVQGDREIFHILVYSLGGCNGQVSARLKSEARSFFQNFHVDAGSLESESSFAAFLGTLEDAAVTGSWICYATKLPWPHYFLKGLLVPNCLLCQPLGSSPRIISHVIWFSISLADSCEWLLNSLWKMAWLGNGL